MKNFELNASIKYFDVVHIFSIKSGPKIWILPLFSNSFDYSFILNVTIIVNLLKILVLVILYECPLPTNAITQTL